MYNFTYHRPATLADAHPYLAGLALGEAVVTMDELDDRPAADRLHHLGGCLSIRHVIHRDAGAAVRQRERDGAADTARAAGDESDLSVQLEHTDLMMGRVSSQVKAATG